MAEIRGPGDVDKREQGATVHLGRFWCCRYDERHVLVIFVLGSVCAVVIGRDKVIGCGYRKG